MELAEMNADQLAAECERRGIPVRFDGIITASGLAALLDHGSPDTVRKWRDEDKGPRWRIAPWRGHRFTYDLRDVAAWLNDEATRAAAE
jgi:hypothetical protein